MLREVVPKLSRMGMLLALANTSHAALLQSSQIEASRVGVQIARVDARVPGDIGKAFSMMVERRVQAFSIAQDAIFIQGRQQIAELALKYRLPSIAAFQEYAEAGGLLSYGQNLVDSFRRAAVFVDKILRGTKPGDLPIEQPNTLELVVNQKTAKTLV